MHATTLSSRQTPGIFNCLLDFGGSFSINSFHVLLGKDTHLEQSLAISANGLLLPGLLDFFLASVKLLVTLPVAAQPISLFLDEAGTVSFARPLDGIEGYLVAGDDIVAIYHYTGHA